MSEDLPTDPTRDVPHHLPKGPSAALRRPWPGPSCAGRASLASARPGEAASGFTEAAHRQAPAQRFIRHPARLTSARGW